MPLSWVLQTANKTVDMKSCTLLYIYSYLDSMLLYVYVAAEFSGNKTNKKF